MTRSASPLRSQSRDGSGPPALSKLSTATVASSPRALAPAGRAGPGPAGSVLREQFLGDPGQLPEQLAPPTRPAS